MNACGPPMPPPLGADVLDASSSAAASDIGPQHGRPRAPSRSYSAALSVV